MIAFETDVPREGVNLLPRPVTQLSGSALRSCKDLALSWFLEFVTSAEESGLATTVWRTGCGRAGYAAHAYPLRAALAAENGWWNAWIASLPVVG